jgi:hypothetical protein
VLGAAVLGAQEHITNGRLQTIAAAQGLERAIGDVVSRPTATWVGYDVPMAQDSGRRFCEGRPGRAFLEAPPTFTVLARVGSGRVERLRSFTPDCEIDAGNMPVVWLTGVKADESVAWLSSLVARDADAPRPDSLMMPAMTAIAMHASPAGTQGLIALARNSRNAEVRKQAVNWLGRSKDPQALTFLKDVLSK